MKTQIARKRSPMTGDRIGELAELSARIRLLCAANPLQPRNRSLTAQGPWGEPVEIEFIDRQPYGFVFTEGQEASFRVPSGHRFVIEQVSVTSCGDSEALSMRLISMSPRIYRSIEVTCLSEPSKDDAASGVAATPLVVNGLSANTLLFSDRKVHDSTTVPADTYLQIWGHLEPSYFLSELLCAEEGSSQRERRKANLNPAAR